MRFSSLVSSLLLLSSLALASSEPPATAVVDDTAPEKSNQSTADEADEADEANEEMIVLGQLQVARTRQMVVTKLQRMGYAEVKRKNGRSILRHRAAYKPTVILDDDGWVSLKRSPLKIDPPGKKSNKLRYLWCLPPFTITPACIKPGGQLISRRKLSGHKERVVKQITPYLREWKGAVITHSMDARLSKEIPDLLDEIWEQGQAGDGPFLESHAQRRAAIFDFWANRSCVKEGGLAREVARDFIVEIIQNSATPASRSELRKTNKLQRCPDARPLPLSSDH